MNQIKCDSYIHWCILWPPFVEHPLCTMYFLRCQRCCNKQRRQIPHLLQVHIANQGGGYRHSICKWMLYIINHTEWVQSQKGEGAKNNEEGATSVGKSEKISQISVHFWNSCLSSSSRILNNKDINNIQQTHILNYIRSWLRPLCPNT